MPTSPLAERPGHWRCPKGPVSDHRHCIARLIDDKQPLLVGIAVYSRVDFNLHHRPGKPWISKRLPKLSQALLKADSLR